MLIDKNKIKEYTAQSDNTVREAMRQIEGNKKGLLFVLDKDGRLVGSISDGDIRRGILNGSQLEDPIHTVMNESPFFITVIEQASVDLKFFEEKGYRMIPVCGADGKILQLLSADPEKSFASIENPVVLMVGGRGIRLEPLTQNIPKPLLKVGNKPILQTILERLHLFGFRNVFLCTNYLSDHIEKFCGDGSRFGLKIQYFKEETKLGTIGAVKYLEEDLNLPFLVMNGDLLTSLNYKTVLDFHLENQAELTIGSASYKTKVPYGVLETDGHQVVSILEKPTYSFRISGGIYALSPSALELIPRGNFFDITDLMEGLLRKKRSVVAFPIEEYWLDIGQHQDYEKANIDYKDLFN
ncbi:nucleotidyltransferase family protein [Algoriphagus aestuariicola]|jgi:dTDP-glucose pyrophosphorylase|uniref:Nucleotidyltransferase family protein n=1 Tax=Algoriphagus aestuariicola TaxID=1852016 RepID=A0ABS3BLP0_9BACT|nr:nucleotidyltransferase family protein [Algoriphagus aestuariicola]MBN7799927.1 nucleotidyltransferase family protein [Algoriphagus aestuariicola]